MSIFTTIWASGGTAEISTPPSGYIEDGFSATAPPSISFLNWILNKLATFVNVAWGAEHNDDGTHSDITADTINVGEITHGTCTGYIGFAADWWLLTEEPGTLSPTGLDYTTVTFSGNTFKCTSVNALTDSSSRVIPLDIPVGASLEDILIRHATPNGAAGGGELVYAVVRAAVTSSGSSESIIGPTSIPAPAAGVVTSTIVDTSAFAAKTEGASFFLYIKLANDAPAVAGGVGIVQIRARYTFTQPGSF